MHSIGVLRHHLTKYCPSIKVIEEFESSVEAFNYLSNKDHPDIVFLDIEMPVMNGFELLERLDKVEFKPIIISAYDQFGIKAIKSNVFDYIVKPIEPKELIDVISRYKESSNQQENLNIGVIQDRLLIPTGKDIRFIPLNKLMQCESDNNYTRLILESGEKLLISKTLKSIENKLPEDQFIRLHNQHIVNISFIKKYSKSDGGFFELNNGTKVPISRYKKDQVLKQLKLK